MMRSKVLLLLLLWAALAVVCATRGLLNSELEYAGGDEEGTGGDKAATREGTGLSAMLAKLGSCESFACLREAHELGAGENKYNFPHFIIVGW